MPSLKNSFWKTKYDLRVNYPVLHLWLIGVFWVSLFMIVGLGLTIMAQSFHREDKKEFKKEESVAKQVGEFFGSLSKDFKDGYEKTSGDTIK